MSILATVFVALLPLATKGPDPADVKPGWLGFIMFLLLAVATALLCLSFRKQLKKIRFDDGSGRQTDRSSLVSRTSPATRIRTGPEPLPDPDAVAEWDAEAAAYDEPADHGLLDPAVREAWRRLLVGVLPGRPARIAEMGSGTGTLSVLLADEGYEVDGVDFSPAMVGRAVAKAAGRRGVRFVEADAARPPLATGAYDAVLCRHVLWAMPDPAAALRSWLDLLREGGTLVLVEGRWGNGAGLDAEQTVGFVADAGRRAELTRLHAAAYWGRQIDDDRYLVVSRS